MFDENKGAPKLDEELKEFQHLIQFWSAAFL